MRYVAVAALLLTISSIAAAATDEIPLVVIGHRFSPETPMPLAADHPLYHGVVIDEIEGLPSTVGGSAITMSAAAKRSSINNGLRATLEKMNMLASDETAARARLIVRWRSLRTPFVIGLEGRSTATLAYELRKVGSGELLFSREISTTVSGEGSAVKRIVGTARAAIAANFASAAFCVERSAAAPAPSDCTLTPMFQVIVKTNWNFLSGVSDEAGFSDESQPPSDSTNR